MPILGHSICIPFPLVRSFMATVLTFKSLLSLFINYYLDYLWSYELQHGHLDTLSNHRLLLYYRLLELERLTCYSNWQKCDYGSSVFCAHERASNVTVFDYYVMVITYLVHLLVKQ